MAPPNKSKFFGRPVDRFLSLGEYLDKVDRVMTQVDRITEDIAHMPLAAFIFRDEESDEVHFSTDIRYPPLRSKHTKELP